MGKRKNVRERGKLKFSEYFKKLNIGDYVAIKREKSVDNNLPKRIQGKTGIVDSKRGSSYVVKIKEISKEKLFIVQPIHLKKIKVTEVIR
jgi:ribosomal protein L21E